MTCRPGYARYTQTVDFRGPICVSGYPQPVSARVANPERNVQRTPLWSDLRTRVHSGTVVSRGSMTTPCPAPYSSTSPSHSH